MLNHFEFFIFHIFVRQIKLHRLQTQRTSTVLSKGIDWTRYAKIRLQIFQAFGSHFLFTKINSFVGH